MNTFSILLRNLTHAGKPPIPLAFPDGTRLLVLPFGGRLLGLFTPLSEENFLWTNPALASPDSTTDWLGKPGWLNSGGDRTWIAPEIEIFIGDLARTRQTYAVPSSLDPGHWDVQSAADTEIRLTNATRLRLYRSDLDVDVRMSKSFLPAVNPLLLADPSTARLQYAGYTQITSLKLESWPQTPIKLGIWNLLQLPAPGVMLIATSSPVRPQIVFGKLTDAQLDISPRLVRWIMSSDGESAKIALKAPMLRGRAAYLRTSHEDYWDLVVRQFTVHPKGDYVDAMWEDPSDTGWVFQACGMRTGEERFNELEYHAPGVAADVGASDTVEISQVWAFRGPAASIADAAGALLGVSAAEIGTFAQSKMPGDREAGTTWQ
jgi:hypothetical protein